jgi:hypothetical protein
VVTWSFIEVVAKIAVTSAKVAVVLSDFRGGGGVTCVDKTKDGSNMKKNMDPYRTKIQHPSTQIYT